MGPLTGLRLQFLAKLSGSLPALFFLFFLVGDAFKKIIQGESALLPLFILMLLTLFAYFLAWKHAKKGGILMIICSLVMGGYLLIIAGFREFTPALWYTLPFLIPGLLFIFSTKGKGMPSAN